MRKTIWVGLTMLWSVNPAFAFDHTFVNMTPYGVQLDLLYVGPSNCRPAHKVLPAQTTLRLDAGVCALQKISGEVDEERSGRKNAVPLTPYAPGQIYSGNGTFLVTGPDVKGMYAVRLHAK